MMKKTALSLLALTLLSLTSCSADEKPKPEAKNDYSVVKPDGTVVDTPEDEESESPTPSGSEGEETSGDTDVSDNQIVDSGPIDTGEGTPAGEVSYRVPAWEGKTAREALQEARTIKGFDGATFFIDNKTGAILEENSKTLDYKICRSIPEADSTIALSDDTRFMLFAAKTC